MPFSPGNAILRVPHHTDPRSGRFRNGLPGPRHAPRPSGRHQRADCRRSGRPGRLPAFPPGGSRGRQPESPEHRHRLRPEADRCRSLPGDGVSARRQPARPAEPTRPAAGGGCGAIAADVCDGLAAAHAKGIVHRDVKPENILLTADGRAKVGDFGIADVPRTAGGATVGGLTGDGFQPGTLVYMSPEQIRGEVVDGRSDVYQVGAMLHEMLAGRHYLDIEALTRRAQETAGGNVLRHAGRLCDLLEEAICKHEPPDVHRLRPDVPGWLGATVIVALARQAASRPTAERSAGELRRDGKAPQPPSRTRRSAGLGAVRPGRQEQAPQAPSGLGKADLCNSPRRPPSDRPQSRSTAVSRRSQAFRPGRGLHATGPPR